jgi:excinuclease ABC subunit A
MALEMDSGKEHLFSAKFACPVCSYSLPSWSRACSPSTRPMGACPACDGLGNSEPSTPSASCPSRR